MKVAVFGAGYFGLNYIRELGRHCIAVIDPSEEARERAFDRFKVPVYAELPDLLSFNAAVVVTPPADHYEIAMPLLQAGKQVLVEKPMATTYGEAAEMAEFPNCMAGLVYLWHPSVAQLREVADHMGLSHAFSRRTNYGPCRSDVTALWDLAPHDISIFNYLAGMYPDGVELMQTSDWAVLSMHYPYFTAVTYVSWHGGPKTRRVELVPLSGDRVVFDDLAVVLEEPPLTRMVKAFLSGEWDERGSASAGADVVRVLVEAETQWWKR